MLRFDKTESAGNVRSHTRFVPTPGYRAGRKVVVVERADGSVEVRYDQGRTSEGKTYRSMRDFERDAYR